MKTPLRMAVAGTGMMALRRTRAFLETGNVQLVGVASRSAHKAKQFAAEWGCAFGTSNFRSLADCQPDFLLVEVPHRAQFGIVKWALDQQYHVLIGSCMATNEREIERIIKQARQHQLVVEAGFEARYKQVWLQTKELIETGTIGEVAAVQAIACWGAHPDSWYYSQKESGGMPVTHMTYAFLNPLSWLFGSPHSISALANATGPQVPGMVKEVNCAVNIGYDNRVIGQLLASYVHHPQMPNWKVLIHGTAGALEIHPGEFDPGKIIRFTKDREPETLEFANAPDPFLRQAKTFIQAVKGGENKLLNTPEQGAEDVRTATAIVQSIERRKTVQLISQPVAKRKPVLLEIPEIT